MRADVCSGVVQLEAECAVGVGSGLQGCAGSGKGCIGLEKIKGESAVCQGCAQQFLRAVQRYGSAAADSIAVDEKDAHLGNVVAVKYMDRGMEVAHQIVGYFNGDAVDGVIVGDAVDGLSAIDFLDQVVPGADLGESGERCE